jgi:hypothetical protein|uniref:Uncharacterized protein n=1 Tax=Myoviridae sp. ctshb19 TaxID=2825194 RepID=A0A8S5UGN3_9CAUD|nr:MAG TPA: hypothetical protein [Myoviridae sp. ctshb19]
MVVPIWAVVLLGLCAVFAVWKIGRRLDNVLWLLGAIVGFVYHLKAVKIYKMPRWPIWKRAPFLIWDAFKYRLNVEVTVRYPDISFHYHHGIKNRVTGDVAWLTHIASALNKNRLRAVVPIQKNEPDLKINETMEITVGSLPGPHLVGTEPLKVLYLHPNSSLAEAVIGFDLLKLFRTVKHYMADIDAVAVVDPRAMIDGRWNTIEYLSATNGVWADKDHLLFKIPKEN